MKKNIVIGCPYTDLPILEEILQKKYNVNCINVKDINFITFDFFIANGEKYFIKDIYSAFIRYPYDLIPPHTSTFRQREKTEMLKTICILLNNQMINKIEIAWLYRNRLYSLKQALLCGLKVPETFLSSKKSLLSNIKLSSFVSKAIGNCFFSDTLTDIPNVLKKYFVKAEDDGDFAYIYPTNRLSFNEIPQELFDFNGALFLQSEIPNEAEYRVYILEDNIYFYQREKIDKVDKSEASYFLYDKDKIDSLFINKLYKFYRSTKLKYLCLDIISLSNDFYVVDINPFGSIPQRNEFFAVYNDLANSLIK